MKTSLAGYLCYFALLALIIATAPVKAQTIEPWTALEREAVSTTGAGYVQRLRQNGFSLEQARQTMAYLTDAQHQGVPLQALTSRFEEGLVKKVEPQAIMTALQARLRVLTQARAMLQRTHYDATPATPCAELLTATALALESGVTAEDLSAVLQRGNGQMALRIKSIVEAGESLHLAGVDRTTTQVLMNDCLERNLRRMEVLRAVRYSIEQHRGGMSGDNIRRSLWGGNVAIEGMHGGRGAGQGGPGNCDFPGSGGGNGWRSGTGGSRPTTSGGGTSAPMGGPGGGSGNGNGVMGGNSQHMGNGQ